MGDTVLSIFHLVSCNACAHYTFQDSAIRLFSPYSYSVPRLFVRIRASVRYTRFVSPVTFATDTVTLQLLVKQPA